MTVKLTKDLRVFEKTDPRSSLLRRTDTYLSPGDTVEVEGSFRMVYNHDDCCAVRFTYNGQEYYFLKREFDGSHIRPDAIVVN